VGCANLKSRPRDLKVKRGDVWYADLGDSTVNVGSEQYGYRPVLVIQNDIGNHFSPTIIVASITAELHKAKLPTHVELSQETVGIEEDSLILSEQIRTIDKIRLRKKVAHLDEELMRKVDEAIKISLGLIEF
jgi:mRNA interferase MazF